MKSIFKWRKIGLALSGGGARGFAHLGVIKTLEEKEIKPDYISGVSAGALVAAFYADGRTPEEIMDIFSSRKIYDLMKLTIPKSGFLKTEGLRKTLAKNLKAKKIEDLRTPIIICTTNFKEGKTKYHEKGNLVDILLASAGIPILFEVHHINKIPYIDGGIMDNLPIDPLLKQVSKVIAVHVNPLGEIEKVGNPFQVAERAFHLAIRSDLQRKRELAYMFIEPPGLTNYGILDIKKSEEIYKIGYNYAVEFLENVN